jgi:hypothetical protein
MHETNIHPITIVTEDSYLVLVDKIPSMASDQPFTELGLYGFGCTTQHIVTKLTIGVIIDLHVVILRLHIVEAINVDAHLQFSCAVYEIYKF